MAGSLAGSPQETNKAARPDEEDRAKDKQRKETRDRQHPGRILNDQAK